MSEMERREKRREESVERGDRLRGGRKGDVMAERGEEGGSG